MALRFFDGFEGYTDNTNPGVSAGTTNYLSGSGPFGYLSPGRNGSGSYAQVVNTPLLSRYFSDTDDTVIVGFATIYYDVYHYGGRLVTILDTIPGTFGTMAHVSMRIVEPGYIEVYNGAAGQFGGGETLLGTTSQFMIPDRWYYVELKVVLHATDGSVEVRFDGTPVLSVTGVPTLGTGTEWHYVQLEGYILGSSINFYDDLYICDGQGPDNNDFIGDCTIIAGTLTEEGFYTDFTPVGSSDHGDNVSEVPPDGDTSYNHSNVPDERDSYKYGSSLALVPGDIRGVQILYNAKQSSSGIRSVKTFMRIAGTDYDATETTGDIPTGYEYRYQIYERNPATNAAWTTAILTNPNNEAGIKIET